MIDLFHLARGYDSAALDMAERISLMRPEGREDPVLIMAAPILACD